MTGLRAAVPEEHPAVSAPRVRVAVSAIRPFEGGDAPEIAALFQRVFRRKSSPPPAALADCFRRTFLDGAGAPSASRVHVEADGRVSGFIGAIPTLYRLGPREVRAAVVGTHMVAEPDRNPMAGARLIRSVLASGHDMVLSETANAVSQRLWDRAGAVTVPGYSLDYIKALRHTHLVVDVASRRYPLARLISPAARLMDRLTGRFLAEPVVLDGHYAEEDLDHGHAAELILRFAEARALKPAFGASMLEERLRQAADKPGYGAFVARVVTHRAGRPVGLYLYHVRRHGVGHVLQVLAEPSHIGEVVQRLVAHARSQGAVALKGRAEPASLVALGLRGSVFVERASMIVHAADRSLIAPILAGDALVTGLAGEGWVPLIGGEFASGSTDQSPN
jgi:hypothetical protein